MNTRRNIFLWLLLVVLAAMGLAVPAAAQDMMDTPQVNVSDQVILDGWAIVDSVYSAGPGFMVIHVDDGGRPGGVAGFRAVNPGWSYNVRVKLNPQAATITPVLYAMLHVDDGTVGQYEFDGKSGLDSPAKNADGKVITPAFNANILMAHDQFLDGNKFTVSGVVVPQDSWVVVHANDAANNTFGGVLGQTLVKAGTTMDVVVELSGDITPVLWPMLHVDDGAMGTYEFDGRSGLDKPVVVGGRVASAPFWTVPHVRMADQIVTVGDGMAPMDTPMATVLSVLSEGPGVLVIHLNDAANNTFGGVAGFAFVEPGYNENVQVYLDQVDMSALTPVLWPMLHVDDGTVGTYEFDGASGLDNPVAVDGKVVAFPVNTAPSMKFKDQALGEGGAVKIDAALIDAPGWLVIHARDGAVLATYPLIRGLNTNINMTVDPALAGDQISPMLHYDTSGDGPANGMYEFNGQNGLDLPVKVGGAIVVAPMSIMK